MIEFTKDLMVEAIFTGGHTRGHMIYQLKQGN